MALTEALGVTGTASRRRLDPQTGALVGSRCQECGAVSWPGRAVCQRCAQPSMRETAFEVTGRLLTYTTVWVGRPGLPAPYTLGQVKIDDGPLVFGHVRQLASDARVPVPVRVVVSEDPRAVPPFWFTPEEEEEE